MSTQNTANYEQLLSKYLVGSISLEKFQAELDDVAKTEGLDLNDYIRAGLEERTRLLSNPEDGSTITLPEPHAQTDTRAEKPMPIVAGYTLKKRFVLEEQIGEGGMSVVYRARDLRLVDAKVDNPYVAIKVLREELRDKAEFNQALQLEADKGRRLSHPNIVKIYDLDREGDVLFIVMELVQGRRLDQVLNDPTYKGISNKRVMRVIQAMSDALAHAHERGIIHADFKPGNIFVTDAREIKVFDFGVAQAKRRFDVNQQQDHTLFDIGRLGAVTPAYATVEILAGKEADFQDDIYALACISYQIFTSEHPYQRKDAKEALANNLKPKRVSGLSNQQWAALQQGLALEKIKRTESVKQFNDGVQHSPRQKHIHHLTTFAIGVFLIAVAALIVGLSLSELNRQPIIEYVEVVKEVPAEPIPLDPRLQTVADAPNALEQHLAQPENTAAWNQKLANLFALADAFRAADSPQRQTWHQQAAEIYFQRAEKAQQTKDLIRARANLALAENYWPGNTDTPQKYAALQTTLQQIGNQIARREVPINYFAFDSVKQELKDQLGVGAVKRANALIIGVDHSLNEYRQYFAQVAPQLILDQGLAAAEIQANQGFPRNALKIVNEIAVLQPETLALIEARQRYQALVDGAAQ